MAKPPPLSPASRQSIIDKSLDLTYPGARANRGALFGYPGRSLLSEKEQSDVYAADRLEKELQELSDGKLKKRLEQAKKLAAKRDSDEREERQYAERLLSDKQQTTDDEDPSRKGNVVELGMSLPPTLVKTRRRAISDAIKTRRLDPNNLGTPLPGAPTIKAAIKDDLLASNPSLFPTGKTFDNTWQGMLDDEEISYKN